MEAPLSTDADRLEAAGIPLRIGERDVRVRFTMRSMKALETRYGSLLELNKQLLLLVSGDHPTPHTAMMEVLPLGLLHEAITEDDLLDLPRTEYKVCLDALVEAINESFPDSGKAEEGDQGAAEEPPGATSTTSPPSDSVAVMASSGV